MKIKAVFFEENKMQSLPCFATDRLPKMQSLRELCFAKLTSLAIQNKLPRFVPSKPVRTFGDYIGKVPNEILSYWSSHLEERLRRVSVDLIRTKVDNAHLINQNGSTPGWRLNSKAITIVKEAHSLGVCKLLFDGYCHLCGDDRCVLCGPERHSCTRCYARQCLRCEWFYKTFCDESSEHTGLFCRCKRCYSMMAYAWNRLTKEHARGICNCAIPHKFFPLREEEALPEPQEKEIL